MNEEELRNQLKQEIKQELKKERKKKRIIILVVLAIIILCFVTYVYIVDINKGKGNEKITQAEFDQYKEEITITKDNWKDYIIAEDKTDDRTDAFGEKIRTTKNTELRLKENICGYVIIKIKEKSMSREQIISIRGGDTYNTKTIDTNYPLKQNEAANIYDNTTTIDNVECIQIRGYIYKLNIPDSLWKTNKYTGEQVIEILENSGNSWRTLVKQENYIYELSNEDYRERELDENGENKY